MATASEVTSGSGASKRSDEATLTRAFRIVLSSPGESVSIESVCGVSIGSAHPSSESLACSSWDAKYEGDSRMVLLATFEYSPTQTTSGNDDDKPPDQRLAKWSTSALTWERPVFVWRKRNGVNAWAADWSDAVNPAGDIYDGVTTLSPLIKVTITQFEVLNPADHLKYVGYINDEVVTLGLHQIQPHELMLRNVSATPAFEQYGAIQQRGWNVSYEFEWKAGNRVKFRDDLGAEVAADIGHDIAIVQSGWNVIAFNPILPAADEDPLGQPLRHFPDSHERAGRIDDDLGFFKLPDGVAAGTRQPAQVAIPAVMGVGRQQAPAGQPIALNDDGRPRLIGPATPPIVKVYQVFKSDNLTVTLGLRLS